MVAAPLALDASEIAAYATAIGLEIEETMYLIDRLDNEWLHWADAAAKERQAEKKAAP